MKMPPTRREGATDCLAGLSFADPYRWLEADTAEVRQWQEEQARLARGNVRGWLHFDTLSATTAALNYEHRHGDQYRSLPRFAAGRWFRTVSLDAGGGAGVLVADAPMGDGELLFDNRPDSDDAPPFISWIAPSPNGRTLGLGLCYDGSESNRIVLIDIESKTRLTRAPTQMMMDSWTGGIQWLSDSSGFFFTAMIGPAIDFQQRVFHFRCGDADANEVTIAWTKPDYRWVVISRDGGTAVAFESIEATRPLAIAKLDGEAIEWRPFVTEIEGGFAGHVIGDCFVAVTTVGAPRGRLVAVPLDSPMPNDPTSWRELSSETSATMQAFLPVGEHLYLAELRNGCSHVRILDREGEDVGIVPLPAQGALGNGWFYPMHSTPPRGHPDEYLFIFSSVDASPGIYRYLPGAPECEILQPPEVTIDGIVIEACTAASRDGTPIPYHLIYRADIAIDAPQPTLILGYGLANFPLMLQFQGPSSAFFALGGVFAIAHVRGGGEYGLDWWAAGRMQAKQNSYDDMCAVAEHLIAEGRATPELLAVTGRSSGGHLAATVAMQRPELWGASVPRVPILDLIGACRDNYGRISVTMELARIDTPAEVLRLAGISPYHLVKQGVRYPAMFIDAGSTDPRCPPWHARKFAAQVQQANAADTPILLHIWDNAGHGAATSRELVALQHTEWLAFVFKELGVSELPPPVALRLRADASKVQTP